MSFPLLNISASLRAELAPYVQKLTPFLSEQLRVEKVQENLSAAMISLLLNGAYAQRTHMHMHTHTHTHLLYFYSADIFIISAEDVVINKGHLTSVLIEVGSFWIAPVRMIHYNLDAAEYEEFLRLVSVLHLLLCTLCV